MDPALEESGARPFRHGHGVGEDNLPRKKKDDLRWLPAARVPWWVVAGTYVLPLLLFLVSALLLISRLHHMAPKLVWIILYTIFFSYTGYVVGSLYWARLDRLTGRKWHFIYAFLTLTALISGAYAGDRVYSMYAFASYTMHDLASYILIDPAHAKGQTYMDAGKATFKEGTRVDTNYARAFKDRHTYCVAPIVGQPIRGSGGQFELPPSGTVDFWAVGIDCCLPSGEQFECAQVPNPLARSGMRLLRDDQRAFYKLAVQEWSTEFNLPVEHPLFFYWVQDPVEEERAFEENAGKSWKIYLGMFAILNSTAAFLLYFFIPEAKSEQPVDWEAVSIANQRKRFLENRVDF